MPASGYKNIPRYEKVRFADLYPGIDAVYYGSEDHLEFDLVAAPGSDPGAILIEFDGADSLTVNAKGAVTAAVSGESFRIDTPEIYQDWDGQRQRVQGRFVRKGRFRVGFQVASYDKRLPLIIDPTVVCSTVVGGSASDYGAGVAVDSAGNIYLAGTTSSLDFPTSAGAVKTANGGKNLFVTKLNSTATAVIYSTYVGGSGSDVPTGIAVDSSGNVVVAGYTSSSNFPLVNPVASALGSGVIGFVLKINASGTALLYSTYLGGAGSGYSHVYGLALDAAGNAYAAGSTNSSSFPVSASAFSGPLPAQAAGLFSTSVAFLSKLSGAGVVSYASLIGSAEARSVAVDGSGAAYLTGYTTSFAFPVTTGPTLSGARDAFVAKVNPAGSALVYSILIGGSNSETGRAIAVDSNGSAYLTGDTNSVDFPVTAGAAQTQFGGGRDGFAVRLRADGASLTYATYLGGRNDDLPYSIALDSSGNAVIVGQNRLSQFSSRFRLPERNER